MRHVLALLLLLLIAACGGRTMDDEVAAPPPDVGAAAESEGDSEGGVLCREGLIACSGACIDASSNDEHCGVCNHACKRPFRYGHCLEGACPSAEQCAAIEQGLTTCNEVCAHHGQRCDEGPRELSRGCGGGYILHFPEFARSALEGCELDVGSDRAVPATCDTPFDWSIHGGWEERPAGAVSCCCTQEPAP